MKLASIPPDAPFLDVLARRWLEESADPSRGLILLPTRRAARALADGFLRATAGRPLLLPRITAFGTLDEVPLALAGALDLPPPIEPAQRLAALSALILRLPEAKGGVPTADRAWRLGGELARLMDEAERAEILLRDALTNAAEAEYAAHWQITLEFLRIVTEAWPEYLAEQGLMNPAERQVRLLRAQADAWERRAPDDPVWVAGTTGAIPAVGRLLRTVARLPHGRVVLPGLDHDASDAVWDAIEPSHPQAGLRGLLAQLGAVREDVERWDGGGQTGRARTLAQALLPAAALSAWRDPATIDISGLAFLQAADEQEEAVAIALVLRDALQTPNARAALITPDRALAGRVAAELLRWGVVADDSAGEPLDQTPPAVFLRLLAQAVAAELAPVPLLALLKHPFAAAGLAPAECRALARALEVAKLRGPRPPPGLPGLRRRIGEASQHTRFLERVERCLAPILNLAAAVVMSPAAALAALVEAAEALAATPDAPGPARLWAHEEGEALAAQLSNVIAAVGQLPDQPRRALPGLLDAVLEGQVVRSRRALRGRGAGAEHPRIFIWGLLEARLQSVEVAVLGGLVEGVWPAATDPGPWLSRPMRQRAGLPDPEEAVGQAAHDFVQAACCASRTILSCPRRRDRAPAVPARWLARLRAFLEGQRHPVAQHPAAAWARQLDQPAGAPRPVPPPEPRPPLALRPRRLRVTQVQTWVEDPYAIYARYVLRLLPLRPLEQATDAANYGTVVHQAMHAFLADIGVDWPPDARERLQVAMDRALSEAGLRTALAEWWAPRLRRIADWVAAAEAERRRHLVPTRVASEVDGDWPLPVPRGFLLRGRADRIERRPDGSLAILDYKTGALPSHKEIETGQAPQLPLEAAMAAHGAFGEDLRGATAELTYWQLSGGFEPGGARELFKKNAAATAANAAEAAAKLRDLIAAFDDENRAYLSQPHPGRAPRFPDYAQLARVAEWGAAGGEE